MRDLRKEAMFVAVNKYKRFWDVRFYLLTCYTPVFSQKMYTGEKFSLDMNKNGFWEIFRYKEIAGSRAEKARGCFGSNKVSKIAKMFS